MNHEALSMHADNQAAACRPVAEIEELRTRYGLLMSPDDVVLELKFRSRAALRMAVRRGFVKLTAIKLPGRKEHVYKTSEVTAVLSAWLDSPEEATM